MGMAVTCSAGWTQGPELALLTVRRQAGLERVVAWYASGEARELVFDPEEDAFVGLPPTALAGPAGRERVEVFKHFVDGTVISTYAWPLWCQGELCGFLLYDPAEDLAHVELDPLGPPVAEVAAVTAGAARIPFHRVRDSWHVDGNELVGSFDLTIEWVDGRWQTFEGTLLGTLLSLRVSAPPAPAAGRGEHVLRFAERELALAAESDRPRSAAITCALASSATRWLLGTRGGDLLELRCDGDDCVAVALDQGRWHHPLTGLARLGDGRVLVGVLGDGLWELGPQGLSRSRFHVGSRLITAVVTVGDDTWVTTAHTGAWRIRGDALERAAYPESHASTVARRGSELVVSGGAGRYRETADGRWLLLDREVPLAADPPELSARVVWGDTIVYASRAHGLWRESWAGLLPFDLDLTPAERLVRGLGVDAGSLWVATRAGLLRVDRVDGAVRVSRRHAAPIVDLVTTAHGLAFAATDGVYLVANGELRRLSGPIRSAKGRDDWLRWLGVEAVRLDDAARLARRVSGL
jgi:hypothetical protein